MNWLLLKLWRKLWNLRTARKAAEHRFGDLFSWDSVLFNISHSADDKLLSKTFFHFMPGSFSFVKTVFITSKIYGSQNRIWNEMKTNRSSGIIYVGGFWMQVTVEAEYLSTVYDQRWWNKQPCPRMRRGKKISARFLPLCFTTEKIWRSVMPDLYSEHGLFCGRDNVNMILTAMPYHFTSLISKQTELVSRLPWFRKRTFSLMQLGIGQLWVPGVLSAVKNVSSLQIRIYCKEIMSLESREGCAVLSEDDFVWCFAQCIPLYLLLSVVNKEHSVFWPKKCKHSQQKDSSVCDPPGSSGIDNKGTF